jgi:hypothetical protein
MTTQTTRGNLVAAGFQQITALSASTGLTPPVNARIARIVCETQAVRWRDDGAAPTATVGMPLATATEFTYDGNLGSIRFIEQAASAKLNVSYYY